MIREQSTVQGVMNYLYDGCTNEPGFKFRQIRTQLIGTAYKTMDMEHLDFLGLKEKSEGNRWDSGDWWIQMGANSHEGMYLKFGRIDCEYLGLDNMDVFSARTASQSISYVQGALQKINDLRSSIGAQQNRLQYGKDFDDIDSENLSKSESNIRDTDFGNEIVLYSKNAILEQASQSMLAQANTSDRNVLFLLK